MDKGEGPSIKVECSLIVSSSRNKDRMAIDFMLPDIMKQIESSKGLVSYIENALLLNFPSHLYIIVLLYKPF